MLNLPDEAEGLVYAGATTPAVPAHVLLSMVSKTWAREAIRFAPRTSSVSLVLPCGADSPKEQQDQEVQRLNSLSIWLFRNGRILSTFHLQTPGSDGSREMLKRGRAIAGVMQALAAAGMRPGGLQLQQLQVPALGNTLLSTITQTLSRCHQLRALQLDYSYGGEDIRASRAGLEHMEAALQQLTQLTSFKMDGGLILYYPPNTLQFLGGLFDCLPSSLVVLELAAGNSALRLEGQAWNVLTRSLAHLVSLQQLSLPHQLMVTRSSRGDPLAGLTALTRLDYPAALASSGPLLALPSRVELRAWQATPDNLETLATKPTLRALTCCLSKDDVMAGAAAVADLTQLTHLSLSTGGLQQGSEWTVSDCELLGGALSLLAGLRNLAVRSEVLEQVDLAGLTALTRLEVHMPPTPGALAGIVRLYMAFQGLATAPSAARCCLQHVALVGVPSDLHYSARLTICAALAKASVVFGVAA